MKRRALTKGPWNLDYCGWAEADPANFPPQPATKPSGYATVRTTNRHSLDATSARGQSQRHQRYSLARAERGYQRALGRSRDGFTSKVHCIGDTRGRPIAFHLTPGEAADCRAYDTLINLPEQAPDALLADKAYDTDAIRADLKARGIKPVIPPKSKRIVTIRYGKRLYRQRNCIERVLVHLNINRAIATRYDQLADSFLGMLFIASARYWIKFVHAT